MTDTSIDDLARDPAVALLGAAPTSTDALASDALSAFGFDASVLKQLRRFGFLIQGNNEWRVDPELRWRIVGEGDKAPLWYDAHEFYLSKTEIDNESMPLYLRTGPGLAFHSAELEPAQGLDLYRELAHVDSSVISKQSLLLAREQVERGVIDATSTSFTFLQGMAYYRTGRTAESIEILRSIAASGEVSLEVAVAQHLVGRADCMAASDSGRGAARKLLRDSEKLGEQLGANIHLAHVKHSMALCLLRDSRNRAQRSNGRKKAIRLMRESLEILNKEDDAFGKAMVLNSLGRSLAAHENTRPEGIQLLQQSRAIGLAGGHNRHVAMVESTLRRWDKTF